MNRRSCARSGWPRTFIRRSGRRWRIPSNPRITRCSCRMTPRRCEDAEERHMNVGISRRAALRGIGLALAGSSALPASVYGNKKVTALVIGGDRYHNMDYIRTALGKTLGKDLGLTLDFSDEVTLLATRFLKDYKMLIMLRDGMVFPTGYGAGGGPGGRGVVSDPPLLPFEEKEVYWITPEEGKAVLLSQHYLHQPAQSGLPRRHWRGHHGASAAPAVQGEDYQSRPPHHAGRQRFRGDRRAALREIREGSEIRPDAERQRERPDLAGLGDFVGRWMGL